MVHSSAIVHPKANVHPSAKILAFAQVEEGVKIGAASTIRSGAVIKNGTTIGENTSIGEYSIIGGNPQDLAFNPKVKTGVTIGDHNTIGEYVTIHRSTAPERPTLVENHNLLMTQSHVGHDGHIHNHVVLTNVCQLAGFVEVFDHAFISAHTGIHQFVRVGKNAMVGAFTKVTQDIPPFALAEGEPALFYGLNLVGLRRSNFTPEERKEIKAFYQWFYQSASLNTNLETIKEQQGLSKIQKEMLQFVTAPSKRGYITHRKFK